MKKRRIPNTDIEVSPVCLGTMTFGSPVEKKDAVRLVHSAVDAGVNFIDTANMYEGYNRYVGSPGGVAEEILGEALKGRRKQAILTTKVGSAVGPEPSDRGLSRAHVFREIEKSLKRLQTDYVDFYLLHRPDPDTPLEETLSAFAELVKKGKARYYGVSNFSCDEIRQILGICKTNGFPRIVVDQPPHNLLNRKIEQEEIPLCEKEGIGVTPYRVLSGGLLTGKYEWGKKPPKGSRAAEKPEWMAGQLEDKMLAAVGELKALSEARGKPLGQYAIAWELSHPAVKSVLIGAKSFEQVRDAIAAAEWEFPEEDKPGIDGIRLPC